MSWPSFARRQPHKLSTLTVRNGPRSYLPVKRPLTSNCRRATAFSVTRSAAQVAGSVTATSCSSAFGKGRLLWLSSLPVRASSEFRRLSTRRRKAINQLYATMGASVAGPVRKEVAADGSVPEEHILPSALTFEVDARCSVSIRSCD